LQAGVPPLGPMVCLLPQRHWAGLPESFPPRVLGKTNPSPLVALEIMPWALPKPAFEIWKFWIFIPSQSVGPPPEEIKTGIGLR